MPIDLVLKVVGERATQAQYDAAYQAMGLDKPIWQQFLRYVSEVLQGDFGRSISTGHPVSEDLKRVFPATVELATLGTLIGVCVGVPFGVIAARAARRLGRPDRPRAGAGRLFDADLLAGADGAFAVLRHPWAGSAARDGRASSMTAWCRRSPGMILIDSLIAGDWGAFRDAFSHIVLPAGLLGYLSLAYISRMTRSFMLEQLSSEYVTTSRVKGLSEARVVWAHAFRNILVPLITVIALSFGGLLEGLVLTEIVFSWPGIGQYITKALLAGDMQCGSGRHGARGGRLRRPEPDFGPSLPRSGSEGIISDIPTREWLLSDAPQTRAQARLGAIYQGWLTFRAQQAGDVRADHSGPAAADGDLRAMVRAEGPVRAGPCRAAQAAVSGKLAGHGRAGARYPVAADLWLADHAVHRRHRGAGRAGDRTFRGHGSGLCRWLGRSGADAHHRHLSGLSQADPRAGLCRGAWTGDRECGAGARDHLMAALCAACPRRDADHPQCRLHRRRAPAGGGALAAADRPCLAALHLVDDRAGGAGHGGDHPLPAAGLGFLGLGAQPPMPEWGAMISDGRTYILDFWWVAAMPGMAIFIVSLAFNLLGDGLRDVLDPKGAKE